MSGWIDLSAGRSLALAALALCAAVPAARPRSSGPMAARMPHHVAPRSRIPKRAWTISRRAHPDGTSTDAALYKYAHEGGGGRPRRSRRR